MAGEEINVVDQLVVQFLDDKSINLRTSKIYPVPPTQEMILYESVGIMLCAIDNSLKTLKKIAKEKNDPISKRGYNTLISTTLDMLKKSAIK